MKHRSICFKTIIAVLTVILVFIGIHMYNNLLIQALIFEDEWGRGIYIGESTLSKAPFITSINDKIVIVTINKDSSINSIISDEKGQVIKSYNQHLDNFSINKAKTVALSDDTLFFQKDSQIYVSKFYEDRGFEQPKPILNNIEGFRIDRVKDEYILLTYNKEEIAIYSVNNDTINQIHFIENKWTPSDLTYTKVHDQGYLFIVDETDFMSTRIIGGRIEGEKLEDYREIENIPVFGSVSINSLQTEVLKGRIYLCYSVREVVKGSPNVYYKINILNEETLEVLEAKKIIEQTIEDITNMERFFLLLNNGENINLIASANYTKNNFTNTTDIFKIDIDNKGNLSKPVFLTNTHGHSKNPSIIETEFGKYIAWLDIDTNKYSVMMNSTNRSYIEHNMSFTRNDYEKAFYKSLTSPFYALAYGVIRAIIIFTTLFFVFIFVGFMVKLLRLQQDKTKFLLFAAAYIIFNYIIFKNHYYNDDIIGYMPQILRDGILPYIIPLIINGISILILYVFSKEKRDSHYLVYLSFFVLIDIYLANLFFIPFSMIKVLS